MSALDDFKQFVTDEQAAAYYRKWVNQNPGASAKWFAFRDAIIAGQRPTPPDMGANRYGRALVDAGVACLNATAPAPEPTPTPMPTPTRVPAGTLSFVGDFETGNGSQWDQVEYETKAPSTDVLQFVTSPVRSGKYAAKFIAKQAYSAYGWKESTELGQDFADQVQGSRFFYGISMMFPVGTVDPKGWFLVAQWYTQNFNHFMGSPPMKLDAGGGNLQLSAWAGLYNGKPANAGYSYNSGWQRIDTGVYDGKWRDVILDIAWSKNTDGHIAAYLRRQGETSFAKVVDLQNVPTLRYDPSYNGGAADPIGLQKIGVYRDSWCNADSSGNIFGPSGAHTPGTCYYGAAGSQQDTVVYHDSFVRGDTFDIVAAHFS